jgi:hypothetical protein
MLAGVEIAADESEEDEMEETPMRGMGERIMGMA